MEIRRPAARPHRLSIFSQSLTYATYIAYILGALVPLLALVLHHFVLPSVEERHQAYGLIGLIVSIGVMKEAEFCVMWAIHLEPSSLLGERNRVRRSDGLRRNLGRLVGTPPDLVRVLQGPPG